MTCHSIATCNIPWCCRLANSISFHPIATCNTADCCYLSNSMTSSRATCHIAGCYQLVNLITCNLKSHVPCCTVLPPGECNVVTQQPRATLHDASTWQIQCHVMPEPRAPLLGAATGHTFDGHISGLEQDRDNLKPLLHTKSSMPYRLVPLSSRSRDHTTSGLAFLAFRCHKNHRKLEKWRFLRSRDVPKVGTLRGPVLGVTAMPASTPITPSVEEYPTE